jgi:hypothetical protein
MAQDLTKPPIWARNKGFWFRKEHRLSSLEWWEEFDSDVLKTRGFKIYDVTGQLLRRDIWTNGPFPPYLDLTTSAKTTSAKTPTECPSGWGDW